jgi:hypothetical protein
MKEQALKKIAKKTVLFSAIPLPLCSLRLAFPLLIDLLYK